MEDAIDDMIEESFALNYFWYAVCFWVRLRMSVFQIQFVGKLGVARVLTSQ